MRRLIVGTLLIGCYGGAFLQGLPCASDDECGPELACEEGYCGGGARQEPEPSPPWCGVDDHLDAASDTIVLGAAPLVDALPAAPWPTYPRPRPGRTKVAIRWIAPEAGTFAVHPRLGDATDLVVSVRRDGCDGALVDAGDLDRPPTFDAAQDEEIAFIVDGLAPGIDEGVALMVDRTDACPVHDAPLLLGDPLELHAEDFVDGHDAPRCGHGVPGAAPDVNVRFTADRDGTFVFTTPGDADTALVVRSDHCAGAVQTCGANAATVSLEKGDVVDVGISAALADGDALRIRVDDALACTAGAVSTAADAAQLEEADFAELKTVDGSGTLLGAALRLEPAEETIVRFTSSSFVSSLHVARSCSAPAWTSLAPRAGNPVEALVGTEPVVLLVAQPDVEPLTIELARRPCAADLGVLDGITATLPAAVGSYRPVPGGACGGEGQTGADVAYRWIAPETRRFAFSVSAEFDALLYVRRDRCGGDEVACSTEGDVVIDAWDKENYVIVVDSRGATAGEFTLEIRQVGAYP